MNGVSLLLFLLSFLECSTAIADELCQEDGTPKPGYQPVNSDYFVTAAGTVDFASLIDDAPKKFQYHNFDAKGGFSPGPTFDFLMPAGRHDFLVNWKGANGLAALNEPILQITQLFDDKQGVLHPPHRGAVTPNILERFAPSTSPPGLFENWAGAEDFLELKGREERIIQLLDYNKRVVYPPPPGSAGDPQRSGPLSEREKKTLATCRKAIPAAEELQLDSNSSSVSAKEACALLQFEKNCLTPSERPPAFANDAYKSVVVGITSSSGRPYCMGTLTQGVGGGRLITSRHCFIDRSSGKADVVLKLRTGETLDRKRLISIDESEIKRLELPCQGTCELPKGAYGPEKDAISLRVNVNELAGAQKLPMVKMDTTIKGCITELLQDLGAQCTRVWALGVVPDLLAAKRLEAQATKIAVSGTWLDEVRWSRWFGGYTRIDYLEDNCAYYTSQTMGGFSGTPLFTKTETVNGQDILYIAGVHSGATSANARAWPPCKTSSTNPSPDRLDLNIADLKVDLP